MPFRPEEFQEVARSLKANTLPTGEGRHRTIAGRAYYAAYLATCTAIYKTHRIGDDHEWPGHELVADTLARKAGDDDVRKIGTFLNSLRQHRLHADYTLPKPLTEDTSDDCVDDAQAVLALLTPQVAARLPKIEGTLRSSRL